MNREFFISPVKEMDDIYQLIKLLEQDKWVTEGDVPTIVVCSPEYSSIICQILSHKLSYLNKHVPLDLEFLDMPYPGGEEFSDEEYKKHIKKFANEFRNENKKLLFIDSGVLRGKNFTTLKTELENYIDSSLMKFGCLYKQSNSIFKPDYCVETFNFELNGGLTFWWEDPDNPYWGW